MNETAEQPPFAAYKYPNRIHEIRKSRSISLEKLAQLCNTSRGQIFQLEKGLRKLTHQWMVRLASALNCRPEDFIREDAGVLVPVIGKVGAGAQVFTHNDLPILPSTIRSGERDLINCEFVEAPPSGNVDSLVALRVTGDSMMPFMVPGTIVYFSHRTVAGATRDCLGRACVVETSDGAVYVKILRKSHIWTATTCTVITWASLRQWRSPGARGSSSSS